MLNSNSNAVLTILFLLFVTFAIIGGCGGGSDSNNNSGNNPPPPAVGDDDDDTIFTPPDSGGGDGGDGGGTGGSGPPPSGDDDDDVSPPPPPSGGFGRISGSVVSSTGTPLNGVHVRAVNVDDSDIQISTFSGIGTNLVLSDGDFSIENVPAGNYRVLIEKMDDRSGAFDVARYSAYLIAEATNLNFPDEYYNGASESSTDDTSDFDILSVPGGGVISGIDIITND